MSFTSNIKKELTQLTSRGCCLKAELSAIVRLNGILQIKPSPPTLVITTENPATARHTFALCKAVLDLTPRLVIGHRSQLKKNRFYTIYIEKKVFTSLRKLGIIEHDSQKYISGIDPQLIADRCCKQSYLRGAFIASGSINHPNSTSYHLEITSTYLKHGQALAELMEKFYLNPRLMERKKGVVVYIKEGDKIGDLLNIMGAHPSLFTFENVRILKDMRNSVNRLINCETANLNKTIQAAQTQIKNITLIKERVGLEVLPPALLEVAEARLENPELNLGELGQLLPNGPKSKSTINHRFRKISEIAKGLQNKSYIESINR